MKLRDPLARLGHLLPSKGRAALTVLTSSDRPGEAFDDARRGNAQRRVIGVSRFSSYAIPVSAVSKDYMDVIMALPAWQEWEASAAKETWIMEGNEV